MEKSNDVEDLAEELSVEARCVDGVEFPDGAVGSLLAGGGEVDTSYPVPREALMSADVGEVKYGMGEGGEATHVPFVKGKSGGCADGVVVCALDVWDLNIPVGLLLVADHGEHEGHSVVGTLDTTVDARVAGADGNLVDAEAVVEGEGEFGANQESAVGK